MDKVLKKMVSIDFEVFGKVQGILKICSWLLGVFFRKYTKNKADSLSLVGWVENVQNGNVIGTVNLLYLKF
jgi:acylphosphatase